MWNDCWLKGLNIALFSNNELFELIHPILPALHMTSCHPLDSWKTKFNDRYPFILPWWHPQIPNSLLYRWWPHCILALPSYESWVHSDFPQTSVSMWYPFCRCRYVEETFATRDIIGGIEFSISPLFIDPYLDRTEFEWQAWLQKGFGKWVKSSYYRSGHQVSANTVTRYHGHLPDNNNTFRQRVWPNKSIGLHPNIIHDWWIP